MDKSGSFKRKKVKFSQVSNEVLRSTVLSLKAKGLYSLIQSYVTLDNFILYKNTLRKVCKEKDFVFEGTWKELKDSGYLLQEKHRDSKGNFYYLYDLLDEVDHTPKNQGVDKPGGGELGVYNNTDLTKTYLTKTKNNKGVKTSLGTYLKDNEPLDLNNKDEAIAATYYYLNKCRNMYGIEHNYYGNDWEEILTNILSNSNDSYTDKEVLMESIDRHLNTKYKNKEMHYLHNFKGIAKDNRLYESGIL